jgi:phosphomannomutase
MALLTTISGIRGTIGGSPTDGLNPINIVKYTLAYGKIMLNSSSSKKIVVGRDARISGRMVQDIVAATLQSIGVHVVDLDLSTTPTVEMAVKMEGAAGGIILTASHNPKQWNALKLLNADGEFINAAIGQQVLDDAENLDITFADIDNIGVIEKNDSYMHKHNDAILNHALVDAAAIKNKNFTVVVDAINSTGATFVPALLQALGVQNIIVLNKEVNGQFAHNPEPLPEHLTELSKAVVEHKAHFGIAVDPDVDRLCFVNEDGTLFGEEYTLVTIADYILSKTKGNTVSNLSSTRALRDVTEKHGGSYYAAAVGEVNVVTKMKEVHAVIGGEGNGGIIIPELHYGRDALIGIALFMSQLAQFDGTISALRATLPNYVISKNKIELTDKTIIAKIMSALEKTYHGQPMNTIDGLKIEFEKDWVHLRPSNTEPIIRIYSESTTAEKADALAHKIIEAAKLVIAESEGI